MIAVDNHCVILRYKNISFIAAFYLDLFGIRNIIFRIIKIIKFCRTFAINIYAADSINITVSGHRVRNTDIQIIYENTIMNWSIQA